MLAARSATSPRVYFAVWTHAEPVANACELVTRRCDRPLHGAHTRRHAFPAAHLNGAAALREHGVCEEGHPLQLHQQRRMPHPARLHGVACERGSGAG